MNDSRPSLDARLAYATLRSILGLNIFHHGLVRIPSLGGFSDGHVQGFANTILPAVLVRAFAYALVPLEVVIGALGLGAGRPGARSWWGSS